MSNNVSKSDQIKLELVDLVKYYGSKKAVGCAYLPVRKGEFLTLLGPSGSGKTTLLTLIAGFTEPDGGKILLEGTDITQATAEKRNFGMVFQGYALFPHMTVADNVAFPLAVRGRPKAEIRQRVEAALAQVQLQAYAGRYPKQLSGGQQQRVALARASVFDPELLLLDEPLSALDRKLRGEMQVEIKHAHAILGKTFIYVTHDQDEALSLSDRIVILRDGDIVQTGTPLDLYERPKSRFVASFLGQSNFLSAVLARREGDGVGYVAGGETFMHRGPVAEAGGGKEVLFSLRPEKMDVLADKAPAPGMNQVAGTVEARSYFGSNIIYTVSTARLGPLIVSRPAWGRSFDADVGQRVWVSWDEKATVSVEDDGDAGADAGPAPRAA